MAPDFKKLVMAGCFTLWLAVGEAFAQSLPPDEKNTEFPGAVSYLQSPVEELNYRQGIPSDEYHKLFGELIAYSVLLRLAESQEQLQHTQEQLEIERQKNVQLVGQLETFTSARPLNPPTKVVKLSRSDSRINPRIDISIDEPSPIRVAITSRDSQMAFKEISVISDESKLEHQVEFSNLPLSELQIKVYPLQVYRSDMASLTVIAPERPNEIIRAMPAREMRSGTITVGEGKIGDRLVAYEVKSDGDIDAVFTCETTRNGEISISNQVKIRLRDGEKQSVKCHGLPSDEVALKFGEKIVVGSGIPANVVDGNLPIKIPDDPWLARFGINAQGELEFDFSCKVDFARVDYAIHNQGDKEVRAPRFPAKGKINGERLTVSTDFEQDFIGMIDGNKQKVVYAEMSLVLCGRMRTFSYLSQLKARKSGSKAKYYTKHVLSSIGIVATVVGHPEIGLAATLIGEVGKPWLEVETPESVKAEGK